jgi:membrane protein YqaA with SNARE-associated domain
MPDTSPINPDQEPTQTAPSPVDSTRASSISAQKPGLTGWRMALARTAALAAVIGITIYIFSIRDRAASLQGYGYPGIFVLSLLANATLILPAPGVAITFAMGAVFNPLGVALAAGTGSALGELTGYLAGFSGQAVVRRSRVYERLEDWTRRYGSLTILVLAFIPNPVFDMAGAAAGALRMPIAKFLLWTWIGKTLKMLLFAYAGAGSMGWLSSLLEHWP